MSKQTIGPRELELRRKREAGTKPAKSLPIMKDIELPETSGKKPVKRKAKKRAKR
jgi:hypothetical protein